MNEREKKIGEDKEKEYSENALKKIGTKTNYEAISFHFPPYSLTATTNREFVVQFMTKRKRERAKERKTISIFS